MSLNEMLAQHPQAGKADESLTEAARQAMLCSLFCTSCADACVAEEADMASCIRTCLDCADICRATATVALRRTSENADMRRAQLESCIVACERCAEECERHDHTHCRLCGAMCRNCAAAMKAALPM